MTTQPQKIAFVYDAIFPFIKGGAEKRFYEIGKRLSLEGHDVHLYGMKAWEGEAIIRHEGMTLHGICRSYPIYTKSGRRSICQAVMFGFAAFRLWKEQFDVVDCCGFPYFSLFPLRLITWCRRKKLYSTWHEVWGRDYWKEYLGLAGWFGLVVERLAVLLPDTIISVSDKTTRDIGEKLGRKTDVVTVYNGLDFGRIKNIPPSPGSSDAIFVGRLISNKNVDVLIKAIHLLVKDMPAIRLMVVGDGPERKSLEQLVEKLSIQNNVRFAGRVEKDDDVFAHMHASKVLVLPSVREGFGIVVLEANACGLPVITINHPQNAAKELIRGGINGFLVELSVDDMAEKILRVLRKPNVLEPKQGIGKYDWNVITRAINELINII